MAGRATLRLLWRCLLAATVVLATGCHLMFGSFEQGTPVTEDPLAVCVKDSFRCNDEFLLKCSADQRGWVKHEVCASSSQCDSKNGICTICQQADMMRCNGANREICAANRSKWDVEETCKAGTCSPDGCKPCASPDFQCVVEMGTEKDVLQQCVQGQWVQVAYCPHLEVCEATRDKLKADPTAVDKTKCEGVCRPGSAQCVGTQLYRCPPSGLDWMSLSSCANEELCKRTRDEINTSPDMGATIAECDPGCGTPGTARCEGNTLQRCNGVDWSSVMVCPMGLQCSTTGEGACILCTPGEFQCNRQYLEQCSEAHVWERKGEFDCLQPALCTVAQGPSGAPTIGACKEPACDAAGTYSCGTTADPKTPGPVLRYCDPDQTANGVQATCETTELCNAADGECKPPICEPAQRRCGLSNTQEVQVCNVGRTGWDMVTTCPVGEFCDPTDAAQPCKHECPRAKFCSDRFSMACSNTQGVTQVAECLTRELCECALNNSCPMGIRDDCGVPVCGDNLAEYRCTDTARATATQGPLLQACMAGRNGWSPTTQDCGSAALCYPGLAPYYNDGYCALCPVAGEVACDGSTTHTCSTDRKSWTNQVSCGFGCVADTSTMDYCAACSVGELRCSGSQLLSCSADRKTLPVLDNCSFGCVNSGTADYCGTCGIGELRCTADATQLQTCGPDQRLSSATAPCANGCIENGTKDYCADCRPGATECVGAGRRTCGADGHWGAVETCTNGCAVATGGGAFCTGCAAGERRCSGSTLQQCAADRMSLTTMEVCAVECIDQGLTDYCARCADNELRCNGATLEQCSADQTTLTPVSSCGFGCIDRGTTDYCAVCAVGELRCNANTLQACTTDQIRLIDSQACTNGCQDSGTADYCRFCVPGDARCSAGGKEICDSNGRWPEATACPNGTSCFGNAPTAYCGDCKPGDRRCSDSSVQTCDSVGHWMTTSTEECTRGCINSGDNDYCAVCSPGDTTCAGSTKLACDPATGRYPTTGEVCDLGCVGTAPRGDCAVCTTIQSQCSGTTRQGCSNGAWADAETCTNGCVNSGTSDFCAECPMGGAECVMNNTSRRTCVDGRWTAPVQCDNQSCVGTSCADCTPEATQCAAGDPTSVQTCSSTGVWSAAVQCPQRACAHDVCVACMPNTTECTDNTNLRTCSSQGAWGAASPCTTMACLGTACVECQPGAVECADSASQRVCDGTGNWGVPTSCAAACVGTACAACMPGTKECTLTNTVRTCSPQGTWLTNEEACEYGCQENGDVDSCMACPAGGSQCSGATTLRICNGSWMSTACDSGCFDPPGTAAAYCRDCSDGETRCEGDTQQMVCDAQGLWQAGEVCAVYCHPTSRSCVECRPSTTKCQNETSRLLCDSAGSWSATAEECPNGCVNDDCAPPP